ncbi:hypothetical protein Alg130_09942 [Pyrenophora tritici-repentis]|nr:hypothetical protein Alg130_09942 [Pyrenophora tritici-repentis]
MKNAKTEIDFTLHSLIKKNEKRVKGKDDGKGFTIEEIQELVKTLQRDADAFAEPRSVWGLWLKKVIVEPKTRDVVRDKALRDLITDAKQLYEAYGLRAALVLAKVQRFWDYYMRPLRRYNLLRAIMKEEDRKASEDTQELIEPIEPGELSSNDQGKRPDPDHGDIRSSSPSATPGVTTRSPIEILLDNVQDSTPLSQDLLGQPKRSREGGGTGPFAKRFCPESTRDQETLCQAPATVTSSYTLIHSSYSEEGTGEQPGVQESPNNALPAFDEPNDPTRAPHPGFNLDKRFLPLLDFRIDPCIAQPSWMPETVYPPIYVDHYNIEGSTDSLVIYRWQGYTSSYYAARAHMWSGDGKLQYYSLNIEDLPLQDLSASIQRSHHWKSGKRTACLSLVIPNMPKEFGCYGLLGCVIPLAEVFFNSLP